MLNKKGDKTPLLFVKQSNQSVINNTMQASYSVKKSKQEKQKALIKKQLEEKLQLQEKATEEKEKIAANITETPGAVQKQIEEYNIKQEDGNSNDAKKPAFRRLKSFKDMSIDEKLVYLLNFPKQLPPVPCIIMTDNHNARGFVIGKDEQSVQLKLMNESVMKISLNSIKEVKMIGL
ncbi:CotO family spore coat protein [Niallia sp. 01092]|uniref:CotO family spore coat protein n=1 Tax=unclassified Niallia TaxID=2837522 RepID=UPI003FD28A65